MLSKDLSINEFYKGIADSPHLGIEDMRNLNILSSPGAVSINFKTSAMTAPPTVSAVAYTAATDDTLTVASTTNYFNGMAVTLNTVVTAVGIATGRVYWIGDLTATTFKLYKSPSLDATSLVDITTGGTGTISSYTMSAPLDYAIFYFGTGALIRTYIFILDDAGRVWWIKNNGGTLTSNLVYLGNDTLTGTTGRAIVTYQQKIIVFRTSTADHLDISAIESAIDLDSGSGWTYGFEGIGSVPQARRPVLVGQDDILYYGNDGKVGSLNASLTETPSALDLPAGEDVEALGELGTNLLVAGSKNYIYPWDRVSSSFSLPIILPENKVTHIVTANQMAYLFAGNRGRIYITNGTSVDDYKKIPDHLLGVSDPYFTWKSALAWRGQLYFSFTGSENDGDALTTAGGVWAIDIKSGAFRYTNQLSYGTGGTATVIIPHVLSSTPPGNGLYVGWSNGSTYGVDVSVSSYYTSYAAYLISALYPVGTHKNKNDTQEAEFVLENPLASGEGVRISWRKNRSAAFSTPVTFDFATHGAAQSLMLPFIANELVTVQFKVELTGSATTPVIKDILIR